MDIDKVVSKAKSLLKGYDWEVYFRSNKKLKSESQNFALDTFTVSEESGYSIRVLKDGALGFAYSTGFEDTDIEQVINKAKELADITTPDPANSFVDKLIETEKIEYFDTVGASLLPSEKAEKAIEIEKKTKAFSEKIKKVRNPMFVENIFDEYLINSYGLEIHEKGTVYTAIVAAVAEDNGDSQISWGYTASRFLEDLDIDRLVEETAKTAISLLGAKPLPTGKMYVLFSPYIASEFLETFSTAFSGESLLKGKTLFKGMEGLQVSSPKISIVDNGRLKFGIGTRTYDDEGYPTGKTVLIENGVFKGFLHNTYTAKKTGHNNTGNAYRSGIKTPPSVNITNLYIENGNDNIDKILKDLDGDVFLITDVMGLHTADPISGMFSVGASGILYRKGEEIMGVRGVTIADNFLELLQKNIAVGNDLKFYGNVGSPSLLFENVMVAGE